MIRRPPRSTRVRSSAASDVYKRQSFRLCSRAPLMWMVSLAMAPPSFEVVCDCTDDLRHTSESPGAVGDLFQFTTKIVNFVAKTRGVLEPEFRSSFVHLFLERLDEPTEIGDGQVERLFPAKFPCPSIRRRRICPLNQFEDVGDLFADSLRID